MDSRTYINVSNFFIREKGETEIQVADLLYVAYKGYYILLKSVAPTRNTVKSNAFAFQSS